MTQPGMATDAPARPAPIGAILLGLGGALAAVSSFLAWASVNVSIDLSEFGAGVQSETVSVKGIDGTDGYITLIAGVLMIAGAVALLLGRSAGARRGLAIAGIVGGVAATALGVYDLVRLEAQFQQEVERQLQAQAPGTDTGAFFDLVEFEVSPSIGLYGVIAGGVLGLIGGILGARAAGPSAGSIPPPPPAFGSAPPPSSGGTPPYGPPDSSGGPPGDPPPPLSTPPTGAP